jgi:hypothetical protein
MSHHPVFNKASITASFKVVSDAPAKITVNQPLNKVLFGRAIVRQDLFSVLSRSRTHKNTLTADIEKLKIIRY